MSDRGTAFTSQEFTEFLRLRGIKHRQVAVAAPWANGLVERVNKFLKSSVKKVIDDYSGWSLNLGHVQYVINNTYHSSLKTTPSVLLLGYQQRNHADANLCQFLTNLVQSTIDVDTIRNNSRKLAVETTDKIRRYNKIYYDQVHRKPTQYKPGDYVLIRDSVFKPGEDKKFKPPYKGPYLVFKVLRKNRYVITDIPGFNITSRPYNSILSSDRMKPWVKPIDTPT